MPTVEVLRERREKARHREERVEKVIAATKLDLGAILKEIANERDERNACEKRRKEIGEAIEEEIADDEQGDGEHSDQWEERKEAKRDELADLIESSEARLDRLVERVAKKKGALEELGKRDSKLEGRIDRLTKKIENKAVPAGQLTKDFHIAEFDCRNGARVPLGIVPFVKRLCIDHLQPLRDSGGSVHVNSGYRTAAYNAAIGGATSSYHIYDLRMRAPAADHIQAGRPAGSVQQWHEGHNPFDGMGFYSGFTHGDCRGYYSRWYGAS